MKKLAIILMAAAAVTACKSTNKVAENVVEAVVEAAAPADSTHTSQNSLDYLGTYMGTLPCADCEGIQTTVVIDSLGNFNRTMKYLGKTKDNEFKDSGKYVWDTTGGMIELQGQTDSMKYIVAENRLVTLDKQGNVITGELADAYILTKQKSE